MGGRVLGAGFRGQGSGDRVQGAGGRGGDNIQYPMSNIQFSRGGREQGGRPGVRVQGAGGEALGGRRKEEGGEGGRPEISGQGSVGERGQWRQYSMSNIQCPRSHDLSSNNQRPTINVQRLLRCWDPCGGGGGGARRGVRRARRHQRAAAESGYPVCRWRVGRRRGWSRAERGY